MKDELGRKMLTKFVGLKAKTYSYLIDGGSEDKKAKAAKNFVMKKQLKFENYKSYLEAAQLENKINHLEKNQINIDSIKTNRKELIENNKLILQTQQRFKSEKRNAFTEEINKITLNSNDDKRMESIDSIEKYAYNQLIRQKHMHTE